jgi:hypothetical protein
MVDMVNWIKQRIAEKHDGVMPPPAGKYQPNRAALPVGTQRDGKGQTIRNPQAFYNAILRSECINVRMATVGARNDTLYRAALKLGSLIADGHLDRTAVERDLSAAAFALAETDGQPSVDRTIASGLNLGVQSSRDQHEQKHA